VVFDLDGTLSQSNLFSLPAIQDVQKQMGYQITPYETLLKIYGLPFDKFFDLIFPGYNNKTVSKYYNLIRESELKFKHRAKTFDGTTEMLKALIHKEYKLAVCSNADRSYILFVLNILNITDYISFVQELEPGMKCKTESLAELLKLVNPNKAVMVGDTKYDYLAAKENDIPFIGCKYGFRPEDLDKSDFTVETPAQIVETVETIFSSYKYQKSLHVCEA
jgi:phosphoglycolate phosphatase